MAIRRTQTALAALLLTACGDAADPHAAGSVPVDRSTIPLEIVTGAPEVPAKAPDGVTVSVGLDVGSLAAIGSEVLAGTADGALRLDGESAVPAEIWGDEPGRPTETGPVQVLARRTDDLLVVADEGLFVTDGSRLLWSPASAALGSLSIADLDVEGDVAWIAAADGLYRLAGDELERWTLEGATGAPTSVLHAGDALLVAYGDRVFELDVDARRALEVPHDFGTVHAMAMGPGDVAYLATDRGLVARGKEAWTEYTLSDGDTPASVADVALDPKEGLYAVTDSSLVVARKAGTVEGLVPLPSAGGAARHLTTDDLGNVWVGGGGTIGGWTLGTPISFAADVEPIFETSCTTCHAPPGANKAPPLDFTDLATVLDHRPQILERIATGQMPPASAAPLAADKRDIVLRWYASGAQP